jgi:hypothetical protein
VATLRHWQPCGESLLVGTVLEAFSPRTDFSDECLGRMDGGTLFPVPDVAERSSGVAELGAAAMMLAGLAWLVVVLAMRWSSRTKAVAVLPAFVTLVMSGAAAVGIGAARSASEPVSLWLGMAVELTAVAALWAVWSWETALRGLGLVRILIVLWGVTSFGLFHCAGDFMIMMSWSSANWDVPPGTGWLTVAGLIASAVVTAVLTRRSGSGQPEPLRGRTEPGALRETTEQR